MQDFFMQTMNTLIRLCRYACWFESSWSIHQISIKYTSSCCDACVLFSAMQLFWFLTVIFLIIRNMIGPDKLSIQTIIFSISPESYMMLNVEKKAFIP